MKLSSGLKQISLEGRETEKIIRRYKPYKKEIILNKFARMKMFNLELQNKINMLEIENNKLKHNTDFNQWF